MGDLDKRSLRDAIPGGHSNVEQSCQVEGKEAEGENGQEREIQTEQEGSMQEEVQGQQYEHSLYDGSWLSIAILPYLY